MYVILIYKGYVQYIIFADVFFCVRTLSVHMKIKVHAH